MLHSISVLLQYKLGLLIGPFDKMSEAYRLAGLLSSWREAFYFLFRLFFLPQSLSLQYELQKIKILDCPDFSPSKKPPTRRKGLMINPFHSFLSGLLDSNQRPRAPQTCALPTALNPEHCF